MRYLLLLAVVIGVFVILVRNSLSQAPLENVSSQGAPISTPVPIASATPFTTGSSIYINPARGAIKAAVALYPALAERDSALNLMFLDILDAQKHNDPSVLAQPDWPLILAKEGAEKLGIKPVSYSSPTPPQLAAGSSPSPSSNPFMEGYVDPLSRGEYDEHKSPLPRWMYRYREYGY